MCQSVARDKWLFGLTGPSLTDTFLPTDANGIRFFFASRFEAWLRSRMASDQPYDVTVKELLTADAETNNTETNTRTHRVWAKCFFLVLLVSGVALFFKKQQRNRTKDYDNIPQVTIDQ